MLDKFLPDTDRRIRGMFIFLMIANIVFFALFLVKLYMAASLHFSNWDLLRDLIKYFAVLIVLGFVVTRLPLFKDRFENSNVKEIIYILIFCLLSMSMEFFNSSFSGKSLWVPFLDMFEILAIVLLVFFAFTRFDGFKRLLVHKGRTKDKIIYGVLFSILGILSSVITVSVNGIPANVRDLVVILASFIGGPVVGIVTTVIASVYRYFFVGGVTALPCSLSTFLAGVFAILIYKWNDRKFLGLTRSAVFVFLFLGFDFLIVLLLTPPNPALQLISYIYLPMTFADVFGIIIVSILMKETIENIQDELDEMDELSEKDKEEIIEEYV